MKFRDGYEEELGCFPMIRARKLAKQYEPLCGSPIEVLFLVSLTLNIEGMGYRIDVVDSIEKALDTPAYFAIPQHHIGKHRVDFLLGGHGIPSLVIECDGRDFHHATREQIERDRTRDADLNAAGFKVLRYPGTQIYNDTWVVMTDVMKELDDTAQMEWIRANVEFLR